MSLQSSGGRPHSGRLVEGIKLLAPPPHYRAETCSRNACHRPRLARLLPGGGGGGVGVETRSTTLYKIHTCTCSMYTSLLQMHRDLITHRSHTSSRSGSLATKLQKESYM